MSDFRRMGTALFSQQEQNAGEIIQGTCEFIEKINTVYVWIKLKETKMFPETEIFNPVFIKLINMV